MKPGDIVVVRFPFEEGGFKLRPGLVVSVRQRLGDTVKITVAYGTSQHSDQVQPWELLLHPKNQVAFAASGLRKATVFCLLRRVTIDLSNSQSPVVIGALHPCLAQQVGKALDEAGKRLSLH